jgi:hypothetical protein
MKGYSQDSLKDPNSRIWDHLSFLVNFSCLFIFILQWFKLPFFFDMYYHLAVAKGFERSGGIVLHNFWEYGPQGAPHFYPPLIHILMVAFLKLGID